MRVRGGIAHSLPSAIARVDSRTASVACSRSMDGDDAEGGHADRRLDLGRPSHVSANGSRGPRAPRVRTKPRASATRGAPCAGRRRRPRADARRRDRRVVCVRERLLFAHRAHVVRTRLKIHTRPHCVRTSRPRLLRRYFDKVKVFQRFFRFYEYCKSVLHNT